MNGKVISCSGGQADRTSTFISHGVASRNNKTVITFFRDGGWNFVVENIHHTTNGSATVKQRCRTSQHFNTLRQQGVDGDRMVRRNV